MSTLNKISRITALVSFALLALNTNALYAQTSVSGNQTGVWRKTGSPYLVIGSVTVPAGDSLRIEPGVVVNVEQANFAITVRGTLNAIGTIADSILITSNKPAKAGGQWQGLEIINGGRGTFAYTILEAAGNNVVPSNPQTGWGIQVLSSSSLSFSHGIVRKILNTDGARGAHGIWLRINSTATLNENLVTEVEEDGIRVGENSVATITGNEISRSGDDGLHIITDNSSIGVSSITGNNFHDNPAYGIRVVSSGKAPAIADNTFFRNTLGGLGISGTIDQNMTWDGDTDLLAATTLSAGRTLTLAPGVLVEGVGSNTGLEIRGNLMAVGTVADSIVFTSDDVVKAGGQWKGIDINSGGQATFAYSIVEAAGNNIVPGNPQTGWGIQALSNSILSFSHGIVRKILNTESGRGAHGIWLRLSSTATLSENLITEVEEDGIRVGENSAATITGNEISRSGDDGLHIITDNSSIGVSSITGNNFHDNPAYGIRLVSSGKAPAIAGNTFSRNTLGSLGISGTIDQNMTWDGDTDLLAATTLSSGRTLTIAPGVTVESISPTTNLVISGNLLAVGTPADSIVFTSDDAVKAGGQWGGIEFSGGQGTLDYCVIEAGGSNIGFNTTFGIRLSSSSSAISLSHSVVRKIVNTSTSQAHGLWVTNSSSATVTETRIEEVEVDGIRVDANAAAIVTRCEIRNNGNDGLEFSTSSSSVGVSSVTATNIYNNVGYGVRVSSSGKSPEISGNVISGNGIAGLGISGTIDQNMTWEMNTDLVGVTTLSAGNTLTITPGVKVESVGATTGLTVQGNLMAVGTAADSITFTSDDAIKAGGQWRGITISGQGTFDYCVIEAAGDQPNGTGTAITTSGAANLTVRRSAIHKISNTASGRVAHGIWLTGANSVGALTDVRISEVQADGFRQESSTSANLTAVSIFSCGGNGIFTDGTLSRLRNSRVIGNNRGIHLARGTPNLGTLTDPGFNAIYNNADYQLYNATTNTILAQNNFWSATDSATIDARIFDDDENTQAGTTGIAIFSPWLNQEPSPEPLPPVAEAGPNQTVGENVVVTLDGRASRDPENAPLTFAWSQTAGPAVTLSSPDNAVTTFTTPTVFVNQTLTFRLEVSDGMFIASDLVSVTVQNNVNDPPVANAGPDQTVAASVLVTLDGTSSSDPNNQTLTFQWTQISGVAVTLNNPATARPTFTAPSIVTGAVLGFQLQVSDGALAARDTVTITVLDRPTLVTFNLDMRPLQRLGLFRPERGMRPFVHFFGSNVQQNALLSDGNADSVWSAPVLQPGGATTRYAFTLDPNGDGLNTSGEWVFELDSLANNLRSLIVPTGRDTVLPAVLFDNSPSKTIAPNYPALVTRNFRPGDSPATVFDEPAGETFVTLDFSTLTKSAVVAIRRYGHGPDGDLPSGIAVLAKNVYWGIEASPTAANPSSTVAKVKINIYNKDFQKSSLQIAIGRQSCRRFELEFVHQKRQVRVGFGNTTQANVDAFSRGQHHIG